MVVPETLRYTPDHEWVERRGSCVRIGLTEYAQSALGDVVHVQLPNVGTATRSGEVLGEVESSKSVSDVFAPVTGIVVMVNTQLTQQPGLVNSDPYGAGWWCEVDVADGLGDEHLLDATAYRALIGES